MSANERVRSKAYEIWENEGRPDGRALDHWLQAETEVQGDRPIEVTQGKGANSANEGEGSRTAAADYNRRTRKFTESGQTERRAREAADALAGPEGESLKKAERAGKRRSRGEDPAIKR